MNWRPQLQYSIFTVLLMGIVCETCAFQAEYCFLQSFKSQQQLITSDVTGRRIRLSACPKEKNRDEYVTNSTVTRCRSTFCLPLSSDQIKFIATSKRSTNVLGKISRTLFFWQNFDSDDKISTGTSVTFTYDYDLMKVGYDSRSRVLNTTGIVLIHPIGVGISKWFYERLMSSLATTYYEGDFRKQNQRKNRFLVIAPDLLGSGSACNATMYKAGADSEPVEMTKYPLFNISDWTSQIQHLMEDVEKTHVIDQWCVVANGGCSPIALQIAAKSVNSQHPINHAQVSNVILSSVPRLPFFLRPNNTPAKVQKSYRILCGLPGNLFWWYACRNEGAFIQKFSEKNLVADPNNLGEKWRLDCYTNAKMNGGRSKYSTFAFLAGTLQDGCIESLRNLNGSDVSIDVIKGGDIRQNRARSWFWQRKKPKTEEDDDTVTFRPYASFRDYVEKNGNRGQEVVIGGRISLAHEDPCGYSRAMWNFLT
ncbi:hypothetical protein IV203_037372 [Nitzschia inconspicua]|uniref:Uncharacterized protein n=1 Tax=Nitzschia inconspicua TaxID=303405 RepID=A0A9K3LLT3_9STRA|nr:hypothetical protein IV203_037372 [Nitzschia inconspicua]